MVLDKEEKDLLYNEVEDMIEHFTNKLARWCEVHANSRRYGRDIFYKISAQQLYNEAIKYARKML